jgi:hypothetical protein
MYFKTGKRLVSFIRTMSGLVFTLLLFVTTSVHAATLVRGTLEVTDAAGKVLVINAGEEIPAGPTIRASSQGGAIIAPTPGVEVTLGQGAAVALVSAPNGAMNLNFISGSLSYTASSTFSGVFAIQTAAGTVSVTSGSGSLLASGTSVRVATTSGSATFANATQSAVQIPSGSVLRVSGSSVTLTNLSAQTISVISKDGTVQSTKPATTSELQLAMAALTAMAPSESTPTTATTTSILTSESPNPANTSGQIVSPAQ